MTDLEAESKWKIPVAEFLETIHNCKDLKKLEEIEKMLFGKKGFFAMAYKNVKEFDQKKEEEQKLIMIYKKELLGIIEKLQEEEQKLYEETFGK